MGWAIYSPPGAAFDFFENDPKKSDLGLGGQADRAVYGGRLRKARSGAIRHVGRARLVFSGGVRAAGIFAGGPRAFRQYLEAQHLTPGDLGASDWTAVRPLGRSRAKDLALKRLFYWTQRFFSYDSARYFASCTAALEQAATPAMHVITNWNFFSGRSYVPGAVANNKDKQSPDAAMGGHDWLEFGRLGGSSMLWTEDWFADSQAYQWSFYAAKLPRRPVNAAWSSAATSCPARRVIGRTASCKRCCAWWVRAPRRCNTSALDRSTTFRATATGKAGHAGEGCRAHRMLAVAEDVMWTGRTPLCGGAADAAQFAALGLEGRSRIPARSAMPRTRTSMPIRSITWPRYSTCTWHCSTPTCRSSSSKRTIFRRRG